MKIIRNVIVAILLILGGLCLANAQNYGLKWSEKNKADYVYTSFSFDVNKAFGIKDNPRTLVDHRGLDFDVELGARDRHVAVYLFYGQFNAMNYKNYGTGVDYYITASKAIDFSLGIYYSVIIRQGNNSATSYISPRATTTFWLHKNIGLLAKAQYQGRPYLNKRIFEGALGFTFKIDN
jgi:hypothetical protein